MGFGSLRRHMAKGQPDLRQEEGRKTKAGDPCRFFQELAHLPHSHNSTSRDWDF
jgi:hypothetical protein